MSFRSGFVAIAGRPNVGKSTLLNQIVHTKVVIESSRPQTTRTAVRGVLTLTDEQAQIVFVDNPGIHKPKTLLGERMNATARSSMSQVDAVMFVLDASQPIGNGDRYVAREVVQSKAPVICVLNKADKIVPPKLLSQMEMARSLGPWTDVLTTSAKRGTGVKDVVDGLLALMPEGPLYYPEGMVSDQPEETMVAEIIREKAISATREEVPHSVAVLVDEMGPREDGLLEVYASIFVERDSQKGILIGHGGKMLKEIGTKARVELEALLGQKIYLDLRVRVESEWQRDPRSLERFGY